MTNQHLTPSGKAGTDVSHTPSALSRRAILQLAGGAASLAAIPHDNALSAEPVKADAVETGTVRLVVNGEARELEIDPRQSLLDTLRETLDLTGTKKGCNQGACGACTVLVNGQRIVSCLTLAVMHDGASVETIEGLEKEGTLHPLQEAFIRNDGQQCGFCTPGQIMSGLGCISEGHAGSPDEVKFWMSGNICRCGAYPGIVAAVTQAARRT